MVLAEPATIGLHSAAAICGLGLLITWLGKPRLVLSCLLHPLVFFPGLIGALSLVHMAFSPFPFLSLIGAPETGQGAIWFFDVAVLIAGGILIRKSNKGARVIVMASGISLAGMVIFLLPVFKDMGWFSFNIPDFLAMPVIASSVIVLTFWPIRKPKAFWIIGCVSLLLIVFSRNHAALAIFASVFLFYVLIWWKWPSIASKRVFSALFIVAMPLAMTAAINLAGDPDKLISVSSRKEFQRLAFNALSDQPRRVFTGDGWGQLRELLIRYGAMSDRNVGGSGGKTEWDALKHDWPYSLNILVETFFALGLWGPLICLAWLICVPLFSPRSLKPFVMPYMVVYAGIWAAWFHPPSTVPFLALAFAGNAGRRRPSRLTRKSFPLVLLGVVIGLQTLGAWMVYRDLAVSVAETESHSPDMNTALSTTCPSPFGQYDRGGYLLADLLLGATGRAAAEIAEKGAVSPLVVSRLKRRLCMVKNRLDSRPASLSLKTAFVLAFSRLAFTLTDPSWDTERSTYLPEWKGRLFDILEIAPERSDLAIPYLYWTLEQGDDKEAANMIRKILKRNPEDPVGLWFFGMVSVSKPETRHQGLLNLQRALGAGIERFIVVDPNLKRMIRSYQP